MNKLFTLPFLLLFFWANYALANATENLRPISKSAHYNKLVAVPELTFGQKIMQSFLKKKVARQTLKYRHSISKAITPTLSASGHCDTIVLKDGRLVSVDIQRVTTEGVYFQKCGTGDEREFLMEAGKIEEIRYKNGKIENFLLKDNNEVEVNNEVKNSTKSPKNIEHQANVLKGISTATVLIGVLAFISFYYLWDILALLVPATVLGILITLIASVIFNTKANGLSDQEFRKKVKRKIRKALLILLILPLIVILAFKVGIEL